MVLALRSVFCTYLKQEAKLSLLTVRWTSQLETSINVLKPTGYYTYHQV